jgi:cellulose biosynthesis protein BcsQ
MNRVYGVAIGKGGQGKSTTVSTVARLCAMQGARVLVVDLAQPGSTTTSFRDLWPDVDHSELSRCLLALRGVGPGELPEAGSAREVLRACGLPVPLRALPSWGGGGISVLPYDDLVSEAATYLQTELALHGLLRALGDEHDIALVDFPVDGSALLGNALAATEQVIMPLVPEAPALEGADATLRMLARARQGGRRIGLGGILLTRCDPRSKRAADVVRTLTQSGEVEGEPLHRKLFPFAVRSSEFYEQAFRNGVPVWERTEDAAHWAGHALLAQWVLRDAGLEHLLQAPRLAMRLEPTTRIVDSLAIGLGQGEVAYREFIAAHTILSA